MRNRPVFKIAFVATLIVLVGSQLNAGPGDDDNVQEASAKEVNQAFEPAVAVPEQARKHDLGGGVEAVLHSVEGKMSVFDVVLTNTGDEVATVHLALAATGERMETMSRVPQMSNVKLGTQQLHVRLAPSETLRRRVAFKTGAQTMAVRVQLTRGDLVIPNAYVASAGAPEGLGLVRRDQVVVSGLAVEQQVAESE